MRKSVPAVLAVMFIAAAAVLVYAGDLNPPAGPVTESGPSLADVHDGVSALALSPAEKVASAGSPGSTLQVQIQATGAPLNALFQAVDFSAKDKTLVAVRPLTGVGDEYETLSANIGVVTIPTLTVTISPAFGGSDIHEFQLTGVSVEEARIEVGTELGHETYTFRATDFTFDVP